jgi:hypothetical protein
MGQCPGMSLERRGCRRRLGAYAVVRGTERTCGNRLDESYVLGVAAQPGGLTFEVDFALTQEHPLRPATAERDGMLSPRHLRFVGVERLVWEAQGAPPAIDASGESDFGHIDSFEWEDGRYVINGDWGRIEASAGAVEVGLTAAA